MKKILKRASMPSSPSTNTSPGLRSGRFLNRASWGLLSLCVCVIISAQSPKPAPKQNASLRANELTLAGLRPGRSMAKQAVAAFKDWPVTTDVQETQISWHYSCFAGQTLMLDLDAGKKIQVIRLLSGQGGGDCDEPTKGPGRMGHWQTGLGLRLLDPATRVARLYGQPDSKSPSSKAGQQLELWYYAFDWAGPDVPQVMEVLCTKEKDGLPGKVIEITLAAPSL